MLQSDYNCVIISHMSPMPILPSLAILMSSIHYVYSVSILSLRCHLSQKNKMAAVFSIIFLPILPLPVPPSQFCLSVYGTSKQEVHRACQVTLLQIVSILAQNATYFMNQVNGSIFKMAAKLYAGCHFLLILSSYTVNVSEFVKCSACECSVLIDIT